MKLRLLLASVLVAVALAACGGSSTTTSGSGGSGKSATSNTSGSGSSGGGSVFANAGNCAQLASAGTQFAKAMEAATHGGTFNLQTVVSGYRNLANSAPAAVKPALDYFATTFASFASALSSVHYQFGQVPNASQMLALGSAAKLFSAEKFKQAATTLESWASKNCT